MQDPFMGEKTVLREVTQAFDEQGGGGKVEVIIDVSYGYTVADMVKKLKEMHIRGIKTTDVYVSAKLTKKQVDELAGEKMVSRIWHSRKYEEMVEQSSDTIKASAALQLFGAGGKGISWAVLDTGIKGDHEYFQGKSQVVKDDRFNFTNESHDDIVGHGTHVAGIIQKLAPQVKIYDFKVLGTGGSTSFTVIEAMYQIRKLNLEARQLLIHGANLSIGSPVPVGSYGCGFSPECQEANRLVDSGVVVCVAASNDGHKILATIVGGNKLDYFPTYIDMGISDPGNAEKVITIGSTHKTKPHTYGISYFSSKGPTGDGRFKPDVVAPGEKIISAGIASVSAKVSMSGTSMATPHVSGAIAQFLSVNPEFIGRSDDVKSILMRTCTDLGRDRYFQGSGFIDVLRMIQAV
ncbi:S8 family peptidase [Candidatus Pacearchaeota archaeon]|nr:S8 family peptidase [Candidatus Pacearchaeota archaeon]